MTRISSTTRRHSERGIALLVALFTLLLVTAIATGMIMLTTTETLTSANFRDEQTALFGAKAGMEEVRDRLRSAATNPLNASLPGALMAQASDNCAAAATCGVVYVLNPNGAEADTPWVTNGTAYPDDEICSEVANMGSACAGSPPVPAGNTWYATTTASATYAATPPLPWKWTRITLKTNKTSSGTTSASTVDGVTTDNNERVCWTGSNEIATTQATCAAAGSGYQPVYVLTTLAVTPSGSRRMIQTETTANVFNFPSLPGPMIFDGSNPTFSAPNSNAFTVTGDDQSSSTNANGPKNGTTCPAPQNQPALGGYDAASVTTLSSDASKRPASYTGAAGTGSPSVSNVSSALGALATVGGLEALVSQVTQAVSPANLYTGASTSGLTNAGTDAAPVVNVVTGDLTLAGGFTGAGILLVEGNLTFSGNPSYSGLVLVIGKGNVTKNGGGNGTLDGSLLVANLYNSSGVLLPSSSAPGIPTINWNGGGTAAVQYDSCWSTAMSTSAVNYKVVAVREMMY